MVRAKLLPLFVVIAMLSATDVLAASFEASLQSLVSAVITKIMPLCAIPFVAKTALGYVKGDPNAVQQSPTVALGVVALLGINGLWAFLQSHIR